MTITVSEDRAARARVRFCATLDGDTDLDRAGFGASSRAALWSLAQQLGIHPATVQATAAIIRTAVR